MRRSPVATRIGGATEVDENTDPTYPVVVENASPLRKKIFGERNIIGRDGMEVVVLFAKFLTSTE